MLLLTMLACSCLPVADRPPAPTEPEVATQAAPQLTVHLRGEEVIVELSGLERGRLGIAETGAHEQGWFGEDCTGDKAICHVLDGPRSTVRQVHHLDEVRNGATLFDNHFGDSLSYVVRSETTCWSNDPYFGRCEAQPLQVVEMVEELLAGHVEPTHWKDESIPKLAATPAPEHHDPPPPVKAPEPHHVKKIESFREAHQPAVKHCCKHCSTGKACGNTCISRSRTCHTIGGCAC